jgi:mono/diheme cytochrome c family protein
LGFGSENEGALLFRDNRARCHGANLEGSKKAPPLVDIQKKKHWTEDRITHRILNGAGKMPSFRNSLSEAQILQLVGYLRAEDRPASAPALQER